jgi:hypothetical protein
MPTDAARPPWHPGDALTAAELVVCDAAAAGEVADHGAGPVAATQMRAWGAECTVRAAVLRHLLVDGRLPVSATGVQLHGWRITGHLDLAACTVRCPIGMTDCYFDDPALLELSVATVQLLSLVRCRLAGVNGTSLVVAKDLLLSGSTFAEPVVLKHADIAGNLDCRNSVLNGAVVALNAEQSKLGGHALLEGVTTPAGAVNLCDADIAGNLQCDGAKLAGINGRGESLYAERLKVGGVVRLTSRAADPFVAGGTVVLRHSHITSNLNCRQAVLRAEHSVDGWGLHVGGRALFDGVRADGAISLPGISVGADLDCHNASLDGAGTALNAAQSQIRGNVRMDGISTSRGAISFLDADITGNLQCDGAKLTGTDGRGQSLHAERLKVGGVVQLTRGSTRFQAAGMVCLRAARLDADLNCQGAALYGKPVSIAAGRMQVTGDVLCEGLIIAGALNLTGVRISGDLRLEKGFTSDGPLRLDSAHVDGALHWAPARQVLQTVTLNGARVGSLRDDWSVRRAGSEGRAENGYWPTGGLLDLDGLTYDAIGGEQDIGVNQRLHWLRSQYCSDQPGDPGTTSLPDAAAPARTGFKAQPYEQLARFYEQSGLDTEARAIAVARRRDLRSYGRLNWYHRAGNWFLDFTIRYGYATWRAVFGLAALYLAVFAVFSYAQNQRDALVPSQSTAGLPGTVSASRCVSYYPCFSPYGYAIDTVVPLINLHQADSWRPNASAPDGWLYVSVSWVGTVFGWALATLTVAGYTGIVRNSDYV